jgi:hypothetical protein
MSDQRKQIKRSEVNQQVVTRIWRASGNYGRLYWRANNERDMGWNRGEIAMAKHSTVRTFYDSYEAILDVCGYEVTS